MGASGESPDRHRRRPGPSPRRRRPGCRPARRAPSWPARHRGRGARRARRPRAQLAADHLKGDEEHGQSGDPTEHAEGDRFGPYGPLGCGHGERGPSTPRVGAGSGERLPRDAVNLGSTRASRPPPRWPAARCRVGSTAVRHFPGKRRGEQRRLRVERVDIVLHQRVGEHDDPDEAEIDRRRERGARRAAVRREQLGIGVEAECPRAEVHPELLGGLRVHHHLVAPVRIGQPPGDEGDAVLTDPLAIGGSLEDHRLFTRRMVRVERERGRRLASNPTTIVAGFTCGRWATALGLRRRVAGAVADRRIEKGVEGLQLGGVGAGHVDGERRLRPPGGGDGAHGHAAHQADQQHDGQVAAPPAAKGRAEPVPGDPERGAHLYGGGAHLDPTHRNSKSGPSNNDRRGR